MARRAGPATLSRQLGVRIRRLREEAGVTQEQLAWASDFTKSHLSQIESGKRLPSLSALYTLADALGVDVLDLLAFDSRSLRHRLLEGLRLGDRELVEETLARLRGV